jgi:chromosome segregation ATPase
MAPKAFALVLLALAATASASSRREATAALAVANPIRKVVNLLKGMEKKVAAEGEAGKKLYEAFMCYCKTAGGDLEAGMKAADAKIPAVASTIKESEAKLTQTKADLKAAQVDRSDAKAAMASATAIREKEAAAYAEEHSVYTTNIAAIAKAVGALEKGVGGSFLQTSAAQAVRRIALDKQDMLDSDRQMLLSFLSGGQGGSYAPSSGEVIGILKEMGDTMSKSSADATAAEDAAIKSYEELMAAKTKEVEACTSAIEAKTATVGDLGVSIVQMKNDLSETEAGLMEDTAFLKDMEKTCATKTAEWEEAMKLRTEELAAIAETIKVLNDDDALELFKKTLPSAGASSFVQMGASTRTVRAKTLAALRKAKEVGATSDYAQIDRIIMLAIRGKTVGFGKVIALIDTMVETLKKEQLDDDNKKEYCLGQFDTSDDKKKALERSVADEEAAIAAAEEGVATLKEEIAALEKGIKDLDKSVAEATEQRKEESAEYTDLMASDTAAKELLGFAKNRLNKFYNPKLYKPPPKRVLSAEDEIATSFGGTMAPTAPPGGIAGTGISLVEISMHSQKKDAPPPPPESFEAYSKSSGESTGVITMIDMLVADLDKEMTEAETTEKDAQADYEELMKDSAAKRAEDVTTLADKVATVASLESDIEAHKDEKLSATKSLMATLEYIAGLHGECDWLLKHFDVRAEARTGEIDALGKAKDVLSGADYSLLQTKARRLRGGN